VQKHYLVPFLLFIFSCCVQVAAQSGCVQSATVTATPVQCNSFRNGSIEITNVVGGLFPYYYSIDGATFSTRPAFDLLWPGTYTITIRDSLGCEYQTTSKVEEPDVLEVMLSASKTKVAIGEGFMLSAKTSPPSAIITSVNWRPTEYFEDGIKYEQTIKNLSVTTPFAVEIVDINGCTARDQVVVEVETPNIYIPNIISIGSNQDAYFTVFSDDYVRSVQYLRIYNRVGCLVFEREKFPTNDPLLGWNGRYNNRKALPGVFTWVAEIEYLDGSRHLMYGNLTVVR
jgi:hypothetical protein